MDKDRTVARVGLIPGDGVGPEIIGAARVVIEASGARVEWVEIPAGSSAFQTHGSALPESTIRAAAEVDAVLKGPMDVPMQGYPSPNTGLRAALGAYVNVRSVRYYPHKGWSRYPGLDLTIIRDVAEDFTRGAGQVVGDGVAGVALKVVSRPFVERLGHFAFTYARSRGAVEMTITHLAPSQRDTDGLFLTTMLEVADEYPDIAVTEEAVDPLVVHLLQDPTPYRILVSQNLYGGILCGVLAGLAGSVGLMGGANLGGSVPIFEAGHGTAPRYAGKDRANPIGCILSGVMMLEQLGQESAAAAVDAAVHDAIADGYGTPDIGGDQGTLELAEIIAERCRRRRA